MEEWHWLRGRLTVEHVDFRSLDLAQGLDVLQALLFEGLSPSGRFAMDRWLETGETGERAPEPASVPSQGTFPSDPEEWGAGGDDFDAPGGTVIDGE